MSTHLERICQFRQSIDERFPCRRDRLLNLLNAFSRNEQACFEWIKPWSLRLQQRPMAVSAVS
jgi:hypothetical protein